MVFLMIFRLRQSQFAGNRKLEGMNLVLAEVGINLRNVVLEKEYMIRKEQNCSQTHLPVAANRHTPADVPTSHIEMVCLLSRK